MKLIIFSSLLLSGIVFAGFQNVTQKRIQIKVEYIQIVSENSSEIFFEEGN
jgi:hypothetical protein